MKPWASAFDIVSSVGVVTSPKVASPRIRKTPRREIFQDIWERRKNKQQMW